MQADKNKTEGKPKSLKTLKSKCPECGGPYDGICECIQEDRECIKCGLTWHVHNDGTVVKGRPRPGQHLECKVCDALEEGETRESAEIQDL